ncbi:hypothetical protein CINF_1220 [Candidatus Campylobacter infans]|uniref:Uncharacterized protein n=1 Tax=Candidatus Campylobacter infans TaxID=2561898 RepID=A0A7H9CHV8_9BACT|nr:hypothetical protein [Candidatus Campylobacter infans]QLI05707.1 hypothetical protein CINF_1220 [Candidatus Campylobacter infans]
MKKILLFLFILNSIVYGARPDNIVLPETLSKCINKFKNRTIEVIHKTSEVTSIFKGRSFQSGNDTFAYYILFANRYFYANFNTSIPSNPWGITFDSINSLRCLPLSYDYDNVVDQLACYEENEFTLAAYSDNVCTVWSSYFYENASSGTPTLPDWSIKDKSYYKSDYTVNLVGLGIPQNRSGLYGGYSNFLASDANENAYNFTFLFTGCSLPNKINTDTGECVPNCDESKGFFWSQNLNQCVDSCETITNRVDRFKCYCKTINNSDYIGHSIGDGLKSFSSGSCVQGPDGVNCGSIEVVNWQYKDWGSKNVPNEYLNSSSCVLQCGNGNIVFDHKLWLDSTKNPSTLSGIDKICLTNDKVESNLPDFDKEEDPDNCDSLATKAKIYEYTSRLNANPNDIYARKGAEILNTQCNAGITIPEISNPGGGGSSGEGSGGSSSGSGSGSGSGGDGSGGSGSGSDGSGGDGSGGSSSGSGSGSGSGGDGSGGSGSGGDGSGGSGSGSDGSGGDGSGSGGDGSGGSGSGSDGSGGDGSGGDGSGGGGSGSGGDGSGGSGSGSDGSVGDGSGNDGSGGSGSGGNYGGIDYGTGDLDNVEGSIDKASNGFFDGFFGIFSDFESFLKEFDSSAKSAIEEFESAINSPIKHKNVNSCARSYDFGISTATIDLCEPLSKMSSITYAVFFISFLVIGVGSFLRLIVMLLPALHSK